VRDVPKAWPIVELREVAEQCLGKMLDAKKNKGSLQPYLANPNVRWFDVDLSNTKLMRFEAHEDERYGLRAGDIVICEGGEAGRAAVWDGRIPNMKFQKALHRVRPGARLDARFFVHRLRADYASGRLADYHTGATIKHLTGQDLARYRFPLPPIEEQRRIAAILDKADSLRTKRRKAMTYLDSLAQSIFAEMFGHPIENPKRYPTESLVDACHCYSGGTPSKSNESLWDGDLPWYSAKDLKHNDLFDSQDHINRSVTQTTNLKLLPSNTVAIVVRGMILAHTFPVCVLRTESTINQDLKALIPKLSINAQYLAFCLRAQASHILQQVSEAGHGTKRLDTEALRNITVMLPSLELQEEFAARIAAIEKLSRSHQSAQDGLKSLFRSLQHCAFTRTL